MCAALGHGKGMSRGPVDNLRCSELNAEITLRSVVTADATGGVDHLPVTDQPSRLLGAVLWSDDVPEHCAQRRVELRSLNDYSFAFTHYELALDVRVPHDLATVPELEAVTIRPDQRAEGDPARGGNFAGEVSM